MVDDVPNLVIHQLLVQWGKHRAFAGSAKENLKVLRTVPQEGSHALIPGDPQRVMQRMREGGSARADVGEGGFLPLVAWIGTVPGDDLGLAVNGGTVLQDAGQGQGDILHGGEHAYHFSRVSVNAVDGCGIVACDWRGGLPRTFRASSTVRTR